MGPFNCLWQTGGPYYEVLLGRRDSIMANYTAANTVLPAPTFNVSALSTKFAAVGLSEVDMVTLSGISLAAHTEILERAPQEHSKSVQIL